MTPAAPTASPTHEGRWRPILAALCALVGVALILRRQIMGLGVLEIGDESETIVTAKMLAAGDRLFSEVFNHHGPLTFLPGYVVSLFGDPAIPAYRIPMLLGQWAVLAALFWSPLLKGSGVRRWLALGIGALLVHYLPLVLGNAYLYQTMAGQMFAIALAVLVLPVVVEPGRRPETWHIAVGNLMFACLPFLAFIYIPWAGLLFLAALRADTLKASVLWLSIGVAANLLWLIATGSVAGFIAYHFYMNIVVLPGFVGHDGAGTFLKTLIDALLSGRYAWLVGSAFVAFFAGLLWCDRSRLRWRTAFVVLALTGLLIRGALLHGLPYYYALATLPLLLLAHARRLPRWMPIAAFVFFAVAALDTLRPPLRQAIGTLPMTKIAGSEENADLIRSVTSPDDRILVFTWANFIYLFAGRLPASGYFFYFPWQAEYSRHPVLGINIDVCGDIRTKRPKAILRDGQPAFFLPLPQFQWASYGGCIDEALAEDYVKLLNRPLYLRRDVFAASGLTAQADESRYAIVPGPALTPEQPLHVPLESGRRLQRLGILLATYRRSYTAPLHLQKRDDRGRVVYSRDADVVRDNQYAWFDAAGVDGGDLVVSPADAQAPLSAWLSRDTRSEHVQACVVYEYADGMRRYTPGCR
jgi:hypothetical protein